MFGFFFSPLIANSFFNLVEFVGRFTTGSLARFGLCIKYIASLEFQRMNRTIYRYLVVVL